MIHVAATAGFEAPTIEYGPLAPMLVVFVVRLLAIRLAWRTRPARDLTTRLWDFWAAKSGDGGT